MKVFRRIPLMVGCLIHGGDEDDDSNEDGNENLLEFSDTWIIVEWKRSTIKIIRGNQRIVWALQISEKVVNYGIGSVVIQSLIRFSMFFSNII